LHIPAPGEGRVTAIRHGPPLNHSGSDTHLAMKSD